MAANNIYLEFTVKGEQTIRTDSNRIASGTRNAVKARFTLLDDWIGITPVAIFTKGKLSVQVLTVNGECGVPNSMMEKEGQFSVCVYGGEFKTTTMEKAHIAVVKSGYEELETWGDDNDSYILSYVGTIDKKIKYIRESENGKFEYSLNGNEWFTISNDAVGGGNGRETELRNNGQYIQWRYVGDEVWRNLIAIAELTGSDGKDGQNGKAPTITVVETVTGESNTPASVENIGTETEVRLKFMIPPGKSGVSPKIVEKVSNESEYILTITTGDGIFDTINLKGIKGDDGTGISILGAYNTLAELQSEHPVGNIGDGYLIDGNLYVWSAENGEWVNVGNIKGPKGEDGYTPTVAVNTDTANEYTLKITTKDGSFVTPNLKAKDGEDGRAAEFRNDGEYIQWRYSGESAWRNLIAVAELTGSDGQDGSDGSDGATGQNGEAGKSVELRVESGYLQWRQTGGEWSNLIDLASFAVKGDKGETPTIAIEETVTGEAGTSAMVENVGTETEVRLRFTIPPGEKGASGSGIPTGGSAGETLVKKSGEDYDVKWEARGNGETIPHGVIVMWRGAITAVPDGWALCNGNNGTPDLRDRFIVGAGSSYSVDGKGGANNVSLSVAQMPSHGHTLSASSIGTGGEHGHTINSGLTGLRKVGAQQDYQSGSYFMPSLLPANGTEFKIDSGGGHTHTVTGGTIGNTGSGLGIDIRPLYYALAFIMKL